MVVVDILVGIGTQFEVALCHRFDPTGLVVEQIQVGLVSEGLFATGRTDLVGKSAGHLVEEQNKDFDPEFVGQIEVVLVMLEVALEQLEVDFELAVEIIPVERIVVEGIVVVPTVVVPIVVELILKAKPQSEFGHHNLLFASEMIVQDTLETVQIE